MGFIKKITIFILVIALGLIGANLKQFNAESTQDIAMDIITRNKTADGSSVYAHLTGKEIQAQADILVSGASVNYPNGKLVLKVAKRTKKGIEIDKPRFISSIEALRSEESETDTHYVMTYVFKKIEGGLIATYDFVFNFKNFITPNSDEIETSWEMMTEDNRLIHRVLRTFTSIASDAWKSDKYIHYYHNIDWYARNKDVGNPRQDGYKELSKNVYDVSPFTVTPADGNGFKLRYYLEAWSFKEGNTDNEFGVIQPQTITFEDTLPLNATLDQQSIRNGWTYDDTTRVASKTYDVSRNLDLFDGKRGKRDTIDIRFENAPLDALYTNHLKVIIDKGLPTEKIVDPVHYHSKFNIQFLKSNISLGHEPTKAFNHDTYQGRTYVYNPDTNVIDGKNSSVIDRERGLRFSTYIQDYGNGSWHNMGGGIRSAVKEIIINQLDPRLYFADFALNVSTSTHVRDVFDNTPNILYGVRNDGSQVELARNMKIDRINRYPNFTENARFVINDENREYTSLKLLFPNEPLILDKGTLYFDVFAKPTLEELNKFKNFEYTKAQEYKLFSEVNWKFINQKMIEVVKNDAGQWEMTSGNRPEVTLDAATGEISIDKNIVLDKSVVTASAFTNNKIKTHITGQRLEENVLSMPIVTFLDDFSLEILEVDSVRKTGLNVVYIGKDGSTQRLAFRKNTSGWMLEGNAIDGVSIDANTGRVTISKDLIGEGTKFEANYIGSLGGEKITLRTPYVDENGVKVIPPTPLHSKLVNNAQVVFKPYDDGRTKSYIVRYSPKNFAEDEGVFNLEQEKSKHNNWNRIEFPWIKTKLDRTQNHTVFYSSQPHANERELTFETGIGGSWTSSNFKSNLKTIVLLPSGVNYVGQKKVTYEMNASDLDTPEEVIENFRGTGRTAVIFNYALTKLATNDDGSSLSHSRINYNFKVDVTKYANEGNNIVEYFLVWNKDNIVKPYHREYVDTLDLDGDGNTNEKFIRTHSTLTLVLPFEVTGKKQVSVDKQNWVLNSPPQDIGKDIYYRLNIFNNSIRHLPDFKLIDVLPALNDKVIIPNENGQYVSRGSQFKTPLVEAIEDVIENRHLLNKYQFLYSITPQGNDFDSTYSVEWKTKEQITDFSQVTAIKVELKPGNAFNSKETLDIILHAKIPYDKQLTNNQKAINSYAISTLGVNFAETNQIIVNTAKYEVRGVIFGDTNRDSKTVENEPLLEGYQVKLYRGDGTVYVDAEGQEITAYTNQNGEYHFDVYERGEYYVKVFKKDIDEGFSPHYQVEQTNDQGIPIKVDAPGTTLQKDGLIGNDASQDANDNLSGNTIRFQLNPVTPIVTRNVGIQLAKGSITISKKNETVVLNQVMLYNQKQLAGVTFELLQNDQVVQEKTTDAEGKIVFDNVPFGTYAVKEKAAPNPYVVSNEKHQVTIHADAPFATKEITNQYKRGNISLLKLDRDTNQPLANVTFALLFNQQEIMTAKTNKDGIALFEQIPYGDYQVVEKETLVSHLLDTTKHSISIQEHGQTVYVLGKTTPIFNHVKKGKITFKKLDATSNTPLVGVEFALMQNDRVIYTQKSNQEGIVQFIDVAYGSYDVVETKPLPNYNPLPQPKIATVRIENDQQHIQLPDVTNQLKKGTIILTKTDAEDTTRAIKDVTFELRRNHLVVQTKQTDENGKIVFNDVEYGSYTIVETKTNEQYVLDETPLKVNIIKDQQVVNVTKSNRLIKGTVMFRKVDAETNQPLEGVTFGLFQNGVPIYQATSTSEGEVVFEEVVYGNYDVVEMRTLANYLMPENQQIGQVSILEDKQLIILDDVTNQMKKGNIVITKLDAEHQTPLKGVTFVLQQDGKILQTQTTNEQGKVFFNQIPYGKYTVLESKTLVEYVLDETPMHVEILKNNQTIHLQKTNRLIKGGVLFKKVDAETKQPLEGVVFGLFKDGQLQFEATTNQFGEAIFENLQYGNYVLKETKSLENYLPNAIAQEVKIEKDGELIVLEPIENTMIKADVTFRKVDEKGNALQGVHFALMQNDSVVQEAISDEKGNVIFKQVPYGSYKLFETKALEGYLKIEGMIAEIQIKNHQETITLQDVSNYLKVGSIVISKIDEQTKQPLANVEFTLYQKDKRIAKQVSDRHGNVIFNDLPLGTYTIKETKPLQNYQPLETVVEIELKHHLQQVNQTITNKRLPINIVKPSVNTSDHNNGWVLLFISGIVLFIRLKKDQA